MTNLNLFLLIYILPSLTNILLLIWYIRYIYKPSYERRRYFYKTDEASIAFTAGILLGPLATVGIFGIIIINSNIAAKLIRFLIKERHFSWPRLKPHNGPNPTIKDLHASARNPATPTS